MSVWFGSQGAADSRLVALLNMSRYELWFFTIISISVVTEGFVFFV